MKNYLAILLFFSMLFVMCQDERVNATTIKRDTTINETNAFSDLFLDSLKLEEYITSQKLDDEKAELMRNFYNSRNYQFAWFTEDGIDEQARAFWNLHNNYIDATKDSSLINDELHKQMEQLIGEDGEVTDAATIAKTELQLTEHFFDFANTAYEGKLDPKELQWHIPRKKINAVSLLDSLVASKGENVDNWEPVNKAYKSLQKELLRLYDIDKKGGWSEISLGDKRTFRVGDTAIGINDLKGRLQRSGDFSSNDTSRIFTTELQLAVKRAQSRFGLKEDGIVGPQTLKAINVSVRDRIEQLLVNLERLRWMPKQPEENRIVANIPEYKLHVYEKGKEVFNIDIVVGKAAHKTVIFNDELKYVVFSPYWNIPKSIIRNEIVPAINRNPNYLAEKNMEQTGTSNGLPVIRQKPGGSNSLGRVKFIFPNSYNIYFHDTPAKSLFNNEKRAFSHGCIRLAEPTKLAEYLLRDQPQWNSSSIMDAMYSENEKWVTLKEKVPVFISYLTAWVDNNGILNYREDIYGHDKKMAERLFENNSPFSNPPLSKASNQ